MEEKRDTTPSLLHPSKSNSKLTNIFFCWAIPFLYKRYRRKSVQESDYKPFKSHEAGNLGNNLEKSWFAQINSNTKPCLWKALWTTFGFSFVAFAIIFLIVEFVLKMSQPLLIGKLMTLYQRNETTSNNNDIYIYSSVIILMTILNVIVGHWYVFGVQHLGMKIRIACSSLIYRKALRLNKESLARITVGKLINLLSNDVNRFEMAVMFILQLFIGSLEVFVITIVMYWTMGWTVIFGILFLVGFVPVQVYMGKLAAKFRLETAQTTDHRVKLMNEIISGMQVIKMYTWETPFAHLVERARRFEIKHIKKASFLKGLNVSFMIFINRTGIFLCVLAYVFYENKIDATYVFVVTAFYTILRQSLTVYIPFGLNNFSETKVSVERIKDFLLSDEIPNKEIVTYSVESSDHTVPMKKILKETKKKIENPGITLQNASFKWGKESPILNNINFEANLHELIAVVGAVGSGKTTLLLGILNELQPLTGVREVAGTLSYCSQEPWLFSSTIRQNILFGEKFNKAKYEKVLKICALEPDLASLTFGDRSLVGERGVLLSGGQKARINLARAVYKNADIYLLDDPLSAVDSQVGNTIYQNCILDYLKEKCIVLVTNQYQYLDGANRIYLIDNGTAAAVGTQSLENRKNTFKISEEKVVEKLPEMITQGSKAPILKAEGKQVGKVSKSVYRQYLKAGGSYWTIITLVLLFLLTQMAASGSDYFTGFWINMEKIGLVGFLTTKICMNLYTGIIIFMIIFSITRSMIFFNYCMKASVNLHNEMFSKILKAPLEFFNINSSGVILNRFSKDIGLMDEALPTVAMDTFQIAWIVLGVIFIIAFITPVLILPALIIFVLFYGIRLIFLASSRDLKRHEATARSPIFAHTTSSLQGLTTIQVSGVEKLLIKEFDNFQNLHTSAAYMFLTCNRAFGFWLDLICAFFAGAAIASVTVTDNPLGHIGVAITQAIALTGVLQFGMRQWSELENQMTSVERIVEYTEIEPEKDCSLANNSPNFDWPLHGTIQFNSVSLKYNYSDSTVLHNVSFKIEAGEKVGIVGRTGAGKSSLILALFRLVNTTGDILIDGVNTKNISLTKLRSKISVIPQEALLFSGTLRENLDPFNEYDDEQIWMALEHVKLKDFVIQDSAGLLKSVQEKGGNFSLGQRQLICLARAILKKTRILILDEATANVDTQTDNLIQNTIKEEFKDCTVLTVAHRLNTIIESDRVLVMDDGYVRECDHPYKLLQNPDGLFYQLVEQTGAESAQKLKETAEQGYGAN